MTTALSGSQVSNEITAHFPEAVIGSNNLGIIIKSEYLIKVAEYLKASPGLTFNYLADMTATDYFDYFEVVYQLVSIEHNHSLMLKTRTYDRLHPEVPSLTGCWKGADLMERELFDLLGIAFEGHPDLKRIFLWEGFQGYPLRKDYL
jgi:NADH-quinone oxidoreductase subunit C